MLTRYDFDGFTEDEKARAVWDGTFLADREENGLTVQLYSLGSFYVELFYDPIANKILRFQAFTSKSFLTVYLADIKFKLP